MENILTELDRRNLKLQHKKERDKRVCDRIKAVLLRDKGWSNKQIAEVLLLDDETVRLHIDEYKSSCKLKPENGGSEEKLAKEQKQKLLIHWQNAQQQSVQASWMYVTDLE